MRRVPIVLASVAIVAIILLAPYADHIAASHPATAIAWAASATDGDTATDIQPNYLLRGAVFVVGLLAIWFIFYKLVYPILIRHYSFDYSKKLFWSMSLLYTVGWLSVSAYVLFEIGFYYQWIKWVFAFLGGIWLLWLMVILMQKSKSF